MCHPEIGSLSMRAAISLSVTGLRDCESTEELGCDIAMAFPSCALKDAGEWSPKPFITQSKSHSGFRVRFAALRSSYLGRERSDSLYPHSDDIASMQKFVARQSYACGRTRQNHIPGMQCDPRGDVGYLVCK
jgi:hypothetical protein